jgi:hypothetical protein
MIYPPFGVRDISANILISIKKKINPNTTGLHSQLFTDTISSTHTKERL